ncbi:TetR/AcrR family transcriptional regulator [Mycobacteroides franklinii]|uniref:Putative HTH-type transcriptional regulator YvdT n=1 Tax=Mycobacteroides franklinii TaxID=948102 RepID=A0A4R8R3S5_9MYCO|nr:TetR/AcrR family transcriptional regulator [Mycobacteroides franklinii]TDZ43656.1 putative HTH-type transcriptional regulator YvdT [Mycobacteroides franklinii]TDZ50791.1 putative HTH-type transcriptional regulator YvdT [Mycobacteroides franklinii]TDZ57211.1 putative HTH-type transcriptional regulator YvdT [Mycobacteroides franklinii]TDZ64152.1 putative HTH-type transcriptional regulator YvdT [Mycobacteroides franklinii]TDZ70549.1 putative HTH-type transcriptional regulator YvdT [Mycobactero
MASTDSVRRGPGHPPNPARARERQRTLTEAAALEFAEKGYHKASITDITQRAGVGRGTFYLYFDTKRDALDAVIDSYFQRTLAAVNDTSDLLGNAADFELHLRTVFTRLFDMLDNSPEIMQVILREGLIDTAMTKRMFGILDLIESINVTIVELAVEDGAITGTVDASFLAHAITGLSMAATLKAIRGELAADARESYIDSFIQLVRAATTNSAPAANS